MFLFLILKYKSLTVKTSLPCLFLSQLFGCQMHFVYRSKLVLCITKTAVFGSPFVACLGRYAKADSNIKYFGVAWGIKGGSRIHLCIRKYFDFSQHVVFTICILFTTLLTKTQGMCEWASKQTLDLRILPRRDRAPSFWNSWIRPWEWQLRTPIKPA